MAQAKKNKAPKTENLPLNLGDVVFPQDTHGKTQAFKRALRGMASVAADDTAEMILETMRLSMIWFSGRVAANKAARDEDATRIQEKAAADQAFMDDERARINRDQLETAKRGLVVAQRAVDAQEAPAVEDSE